MSNQLTESAGARTHFQKCKFCGKAVNLSDEGTQYADGTAAHESCDDLEQFEKANESDWRD